MKQNQHCAKYISKHNTDCPKIPYNLVLLGVAPIICMLLPIFYVNVRNAANKQLQFPLIKYIHKIRGNKLIEASDKSIELLFDSFLNSPLRD